MLAGVGFYHLAWPEAKRRNVLHTRSMHTRLQFSRADTARWPLGTLPVHREYYRMMWKAELGHAAGATRTLL
jgi:hypothetical protein